MKLNKKLLESELKKTRKLMEDISIINKSDIDKAGTWNVPHIIKTNKGLTAYEKNGYTLTSLNNPINNKMGKVNGPGDLRVASSDKLKNAVYMTQEQADELNLLGDQIQDLISQYNEIFNQYTKN